MAVFVVRGVLSFLIVWMVNPALSFFEVLNFVFSQDPRIQDYMDQSKPLLLLGGGVYLLLIFLAWFFLEEKNYAFIVEHFIHRQSVWFYAIASVSLTAIIYFSLKIDPLLALAASVGVTAFFITDGFKKNAEAKEKELLNPNLGAWSKIYFWKFLTPLSPLTASSALSPSRSRCR